MDNIPDIGLGTYRLKGQFAYESVLKGLKLGYTLVDTASLYNNENEIGKAIREAILDYGLDRTNLFICTKIWVTDIKKGKNYIIKSIKKSLKNLQLDYIDLVLLHNPVDSKIEESWIIMEDIYLGKIKDIENKVKYIGVSNYNIDDLERIKKISRINPFINQIEISPYFNRVDLVDYCQKNNIKIMAHSSLVNGLKFNDIKLIELSNKLNIPMSLILLRWAIQKNFIIIPKSNNKEHLLENLKVIDVCLDTDVINYLDSFNENFCLFQKKYI